MTQNCIISGIQTHPQIIITLRSTLTTIVVPIKVLSMSQIDLFENNLYLIGIFDSMCKSFVLSNLNL